jgi:hypothetical protein
MIAAVFFSLMVLTHWITAWIFFGFLIFAAFAFRPRGIVALSALAVLAIFVAWPVIRMADASGEPFGVARFVFYNGLSSGSEAAVMRTQDLSQAPLGIDGLMLKILGTTLVQATELIPFLGGIIAAPIFFISLLHPFKRPSIANFRWLILLMWFFAAIGMAIFGIDSSNPLHPNQIHILFAPIMAAYGLAFVSILWSRITLVSSQPMMRNVHYIAIVAFSAAPMLLTLPKEIRMYLSVSDRGGWPMWPPYYPLVLNRGLGEWVEKDRRQPEIVVSDLPWAVAWYSDAHCIWLPNSMNEFTKLDAKATDIGTRFSGILITPNARSGKASYEGGDFAALALDGIISSVTGPTPNRPGFVVYDKAPTLTEVYRRFPFRTPLLGQQMIYYSEKQISDPNQSN